jgi:hypothetical protein
MYKYNLGDTIKTKKSAGIRESFPGNYGIIFRLQEDTNLLPYIIKLNNYSLDGQVEFSVYDKLISRCKILLIEKKL